MPNPDERRRQHMQQKAADELVGFQRHDFLFVLIAVVFPLKTDSPIVNCEDALIGERHPMGVAADIAKHLLRSGKGSLGIDHPGVGT